MVVLGLAALLLTATPAEPADAQLSYAHSLQADADHFRAVTEYKRALFLYPALQTGATAGLARSYLHVGDNRLSRVHARRAASLNPDLRDEMLFLEWISLQRDGLPHEAGQAWRMLNVEPTLPETTAKAHLTRAVDSLAHGDLEGGRRFLEHAAQQAPDSTPGDTARHISAAIQPPSQRKSPRVAGALGLLMPGAGQIYAGNTWEGIGNFALNAAFAAGAVHSYRSGGRFEIWLLPLGSFYLGGVGRAMSLVNDQYMHDRLRAGEQAVTPYLADLEGMGIPVR
jgi:tetratricopeptide (TPR) repeat protein